MQFGGALLHAAFEGAVGGLQGGAQLQDLFSDSLVKVGAFDEFQVDQSLPEQDGIPLVRFLQLMVERGLQVLSRDQALLNKVFPHARHEHFGR